MTLPLANRSAAADRLASLTKGARWMLVSWLVWTAVALIDVTPSILAVRSGTEGEVNAEFFRRYLFTHVAIWYTWWLLTPLVFWLAERVQLRARSSLRWVAIHSVAALGTSYAGRSAAGAVLSLFLEPARYPGLPIVGFLQYGAILAVATVAGMRRRERDQAIASAQLAAELAEARAHAVSAQLKPHFLYNAMNSIAMLIRARNNEAALEAVLGYSELLRQAVETTAADVSLQEEMGFIEQYVAIERMRFGDSFSASMTVAADAADAVVPSFILQPIVENAFRHGLSTLERDALLEITASRRDGLVHLEVRDNGVGLPPDWRLEQGGVGLRTTQSRLVQRYGTGCHFELHSPAEGGTVVIIEFPYTAAPRPVARG
jgi:signal transduction histidine kinase